jgi:hypothetical protein
VTIYRLYTENGNRAGFWVQHRTWKNLCARVRSVGGREFGKLPGKAPLHNNATISIECFDVRSGRPAPIAESDEQLTDKNFVSIAEPSWY